MSSYCSEHFFFFRRPSHSFRDKAVSSFVTTVPHQNTPVCFWSAGCQKIIRTLSCARALHSRLWNKLSMKQSDLFQKPNIVRLLFVRKGPCDWLWALRIYAAKVSFLQLIELLFCWSLQQLGSNWASSHWQVIDNNFDNNSDSGIVFHRLYFFIQCCHTFYKMFLGITHEVDKTERLQLARGHLVDFLVGWTFESRLT